MSAQLTLTDAEMEFALAAVRQHTESNHEDDCYPAALTLQAKVEKALRRPGRRSTSQEGGEP